MQCSVSKLLWRAIVPCDRERLPIMNSRTNAKCLQPKQMPTLGVNLCLVKLMRRQYVERRRKVALSIWLQSDSRHQCEILAFALGGVLQISTEREFSTPLNEFSALNGRQSRGASCRGYKGGRHLHSRNFGAEPKTIEAALGDCLTNKARHL